MKKPSNKITRRKFLDQSLKTAVLMPLAAVAVPTIVPSTVFGKNAPSNRINVGAIGAGRISRTHDMPGVWRQDIAQLMAVCDLDS
jgi:hypothetical protein